MSEGDSWDTICGHTAQRSMIGLKREQETVAAADC